MTNEMIIMNESQRFAPDGIIKYTGREFKVPLADGGMVTLKETEPIHTYAGWQEIGYQVRKGEKAITKLTIWKHTAKEDKETGEQTTRLFLKTASFFSLSQVEKKGEKTA